MTGSIQIKKDRPNYYIVLAFKDETTGKNKTKWISTDIPHKGNNKRLANERLKEVLAQYEDNNIDLGKNILFTEFIKQWLENLRPSIEEVTYDTYRMIVYKQIIPFYEKKKLKVKDVTPLHIQQYINFKLEKVSPNTVRKHLWNLSKCFNSAIKQKLISFNPVKGIDMPKKIKYTGAKYYNEKQIDELLRASKGDLIEGVILLAVFYGMRRSEIIGLKWDSVDLSNKVFTIRHTVVRVDKELHKKDSTKNNSSYRTMPMPEMILDMFLKIKEQQKQNKLLQPNDYIDEGYIFTHPNGKLISPSLISKKFKQFLIENNLEIIKFHDLRHSSASYLLYLGYNLKAISVWLGHGDIGTTMNLYAHMDLDGKRSIAENLNEKFSNMEKDFAPN